LTHIRPGICFDKRSRGVEFFKKNVTTGDLLGGVLGGGGVVVGGGGGGLGGLNKKTFGENLKASHYFQGGRGAGGGA